MSISPQKLQATYTRALRLIETLPEDERLRQDTIEGETDLFEVMDQYAEAALAAAALAELARNRARRLEARAERHRKVVEHIVTGLELGVAIQRPLYSASLTHTRKVMPPDMSLLPRKYVREAADMIALGKALRAGEDVPGATLGNAEPHLTLRVQRRPGELREDEE